MSVSVILELSGHIIDSLTLAKVIDKIQLTGFDYQVNDLRVGQTKSAVSTAQLTVWAPTHEELQLLLEELRVYGAHPLDSRPAQSLPCEVAGVLPPGGYLRQNPALEVCQGEEWTSVACEDQDYTVILEEAGPRLLAVRHLKAGDRVVKGHQGVRVVPVRGMGPQ